MTKEELLKQIQALPDGIEICIMNNKLNFVNDWGDEGGCSKGIYPKFEIGEMPEDGRPEGSKPWAFISFEEEEWLADEQQETLRAQIEKLEAILPRLGTGPGKKELRSELESIKIQLNSVLPIE